VTSPPSTAVTRVDLRLQKAIVTGDTNKATAVDSAPSQPATHAEKSDDAWDTRYKVLLSVGQRPALGFTQSGDKTAEA